MKNKLIATLLAVAMVCTMLPMAVFAVPTPRAAAPATLEAGTTNVVADTIYAEGALAGTGADKHKNGGNWYSSLIDTAGVTWEMTAGVGNNGNDKTFDVVVPIKYPVGTEITSADTALWDNLNNFKNVDGAAADVALGFQLGLPTTIGGTDVDYSKTDATRNATPLAGDLHVYTADNTSFGVIKTIAELQSTTTTTACTTIMYTNVATADPSANGGTPTKYTISNGTNDETQRTYVYTLKDSSSNTLAAYTINIKVTYPQPDVAETLEATAPASDSGNDGKITGLSSTKSYEYKKAADLTYTTVTASSTEITGLAAGAYHVRYAADATSNLRAGADTEVTVPAYQAPTPTNHAITAVVASNGSFTVKVGDTDVTAAAKDAVVAIATTPDANYEVDEVTVAKTGDTNTAVSVTGSDNAYTFTMPDYPVTITVTFKATTVTPPTHVPVTGITGIPASMTAGTLTLSGTVAPDTATNKAIVWTVKNAGTTGASFSGNVLSAPTAGTVVVTATITNGATTSTDYTQDFTIQVNASQATADQAAVNAAKTAIEGATYKFAQADANTSAAVRTAVEKQIKAMSAVIGKGLTVAVTMDNTFTAAIIGTEGDTDGTPGSFAFTATIDKGTATQATTYSVNGTITATAYVAPAAPKLPTPAKPTWISTSAAIAWTAVDNASGYSVQLYKNGEKLGVPVNVTPGVTISHNFEAAAFTAVGTYTATITAIGAGDYKNSDESPKSLGKVTEPAAPKPPVVAPSAPSAITQPPVLNNSKVQEAVADTNTVVKDSNGDKIDILPTDEIKMVIDAPAAGDKTALEAAVKPANIPNIDMTKTTATVSIEIDLKVSAPASEGGAEKGSIKELGKPIEVKVPTPAALAAFNHFKVLHLKDGGAIETIDAVKDSSGNIVFNVDSFSAFSIVGYVPAAANPGGYWYGGWAGSSDVTVSFIANGGSYVNPVKMSAGGTIDPYKYIPTKSGYAFGGWYQDSGLTQLVTGNTRFNANTTLYVRWLEDTAKPAPSAPNTWISGGTGTANPQTGDSWFKNLFIF